DDGEANPFPVGGGGDGRGADGGDHRSDRRSGSHGIYTRLTILRPNRPLGIRVSARMISASAIDSFISAQKCGTKDARFSTTPTRKPPKTAPPGLVSPPTPAPAKP